MGFMGCGKSTFGKKLAKALSWSFIDLDDYIEKQEGITISEIFATHGEAYFRELETEVLSESKAFQNTVISTGGGLPCFNNNDKYIKALGVGVYIKLPPKVLRDRLKNEKAKRPLLANLSDEAMLSFIESKLEEREKFYESSEVIFDYLKTPEKVFVAEIKKLVGFEEL